MRAIIVFAASGCMVLGPFNDTASAKTYADNNFAEDDDNTTWAVIPFTTVGADDSGLVEPDDVIESISGGQQAARLLSLGGYD